MANFWLTFVLVTVCYGLAVVVPIISDVIQVLGDTSSPLVSHFYNRSASHSRSCSTSKLTKATLGLVNEYSHTSSIL